MNERDIVSTLDLRVALSSFKRCAEDAPEGCYEEAKLLNAVLGAAVTRLMHDLRSLGLNANACDLAFDLEASMYDYAKRSNPGATVFPTAEGFGSSMDRPERTRVLAQAICNRDFLAARGEQAHGRQV